MIKEYITLVIDHKFITNEISSELYVKLLERVELMNEKDCQSLIEQVAYATKGVYTPAFKTIMGHRPSSWVPASKTITGSVKRGVPASKTITGYRIFPSAASKIGSKGRVVKTGEPQKPITKIVKKKAEVEYR